MDIQHGTASGYQACHQRPEGSCDACRAAHAEKLRRYRGGAGGARHRDREKAYQRALADLRDRHSDEFDAVYAVELARAQREQGIGS